MPRRVPPPAVLWASPEDVEAQFYEAMQLGQIEQMMALWADDDDIVCVHPGGVRVVGAAHIRASFEAVFAQGGVNIRPEGVHRMHTLACAVHHLAERVSASTPQGVQTAFTLATNVYVKTAQGWRIVAHHASPAAAAEPVSVGDDDPAGPSTLH